MGLDSWISITCPAPSAEHRMAAEARQTVLTKPRGSLGALERVVEQLAACQSRSHPRADAVQIILFAGDHGVAANGVSAYPSAVTVQMLHNFASGGAAISVLARELNASLEVVDAGSLATNDIHGVITDRPCRGTRDFAAQPAMTADEVQFALAAGRRAVMRAVRHRPDLLVLGEMGIGNTTAATAIAAALLDLPARDLVGAGTGLDGEGVAHKAQVIDDAIGLHDLRHGQAQAARVLACVGGLEIAALTGAIVAAAQIGIPVLIDGFIVTVAAFAASRINPSCTEWLIYSHRSSERGHRTVLQALRAEPLLDLGLRLGEGSGAALAVPMIRLACALHSKMATFDEARVSGPSSSP